ncbi:MAG TPA: DUF1643 domain-containing protein [Chloroflexota bacterium]|nr:DUF1643 domain-containing protein [Chloroflexota bacterium]
MADHGGLQGPVHTASGAAFDAAGRYRYLLWRRWDSSLPAVTFVMLNPSTATAETDDPTIRRCSAFARSWGCGGIEVVNLFAFKTSNPDILRSAPDPEGPLNRHMVSEALDRGAAIIVAWGNLGRLEEASGAVRRRMESIYPLLCLGHNRSGAPRHPLYLPRTTTPVPYRPRNGINTPFPSLSPCQTTP